MRDGAVGAAEHRSHEQRGSEHPARAADPHRQARREDLRCEQTEENKDDVLPGDGFLQDRVADAVHLGDGEQEQTEEHAADGRAQPFRAVAPKPVGDVLARVEHADERQPDTGG